MVTVLIGDLFESAAQTLVNTVNGVGVMGKGIALGFKKRFPDMYHDYVERCKRSEVHIGRPYLYRRLYEPWILNFPTKDHWRSVSKLSDIEHGLAYLYDHYQEWEITSLAVPPLGCGHGQLDWRVVGPTLYRHLSRFEIPIKLYAPFQTPEEELDPRFLAGQELPYQQIQEVSSNDQIEAGWFALAALLARVERERYHHPVGRTSFQKLAYFATEAGIPTDLSFRQASYGPFAEGLKRIITRLENNGLICEERQGRMIRVRTGPAFRDALPVFMTNLEEWSDALSKVSDLFLRMNTRQAEVAATVHFAAHHLMDTNGKPTEMDVLETVRDWKKRRRPPLDDEAVASAIRSLNVLGWIAADVSPELIEDELLEESDG